MIEATAWVIKYFNEASDWYFLFFFNIKGIKTIKLISIKSQHINQEFEEIIKKIENKNTKKNKYNEGCIKILKRYNHKRGMNPSALISLSLKLRL